MSAPGFFTIKWIMPAGYTHYYQAGNLTIIPAVLDDETRPSDVVGMPKSVQFMDATGMACSIDSGVVYIMNDKGSTIDKVVFSATTDLVEPVFEASPPPPAPGASRRKR